MCDRRVRTPPTSLPDLPSLLCLSDRHRRCWIGHQNVPSGVGRTIPFSIKVGGVIGRFSLYRGRQFGCVDSYQIPPETLFYPPIQRFEMKNLCCIESSSYFEIKIRNILLKPHTVYCFVTAMTLSWLFHGC